MIVRNTLLESKVMKKLLQIRSKNGVINMGMVLSYRYTNRYTLISQIYTDRSL